MQSVICFLVVVNMYLLNTEQFGYMMKPVEYSSAEEARQDFVNYKLKQLGKQSRE